MADDFTTKEIVTRVLNKIESMDDKIDKIHSQVTYTNGTVRLHTKLIWGSFGFTLAVLLGLLAVI